MSTLEKTIKNSEINLPKDKVIYLTYESNMLVPCTLTQEDDNLIFAFNISGMYLFEEIKSKDILEKYTFLINCANFETLRNEYYFSLEPDNIVFDFNMNPKAIMRNAPIEDDNFLDEYNALIGEVLYPKYKFADYYNGGKDLYKKKSILKQINKLETVDEIKDCLLEEYQKELDIIGSEKRLVNKKNVVASRIAIPVMVLVLCAVCVKSYFVLFVDVPYKDCLIKANNAYLAEDYFGTQEALKTIKVDKLDISDKYILAKSYVIMESLTPEQKENVITGITLKSDERALNYWIELGRLNFTQAVDYAKRLDDDELLLFALIKESNSLKNDITISGEEKATKIESLESQIKVLKEQIEKRQTELD